MRCPRLPVSVALCVSFLAVQVGGLHMHVDAAGTAGSPRGVHLHTQMLHSHGGETHVHHPDTLEHEHPGDREHAGDNDISPAEMRGGNSTLADFDLNLHLGLLIDLVQVYRVRPSSSEPLPLMRKSRWRPPLRAPPPVS